jgi:adenine phosphoribosyltransferase
LPRPDGFSDFPRSDLETLKARIRHIPDFPKPGILFYDITTLLNDPQGFREMIDALSLPYVDKGIEQVVGIESRGFILGAAVANRLNAGFVPIRKPGKLPSKTYREDYALEYGTDCLEIHHDAFEAGRKVLLVDDVLATGGTARAASGLIRRVGGDLVGLSFLIELGFLNGRSKLEGEHVYSVLQY